MRANAAAVLRVFLFVYMLYAYAKFVEFFVRPKESKKAWLRRVYAGRTVAVFDNVMLVLMVVVTGITFYVGVEALSFTAGLLVGMTLIQIFFHRFAEPLSEEWMPSPPLTPLKMMSHAIQAMPSNAWRELSVMTVLFAVLFVLLLR